MLTASRAYPTGPKDAVQHLLNSGMEKELMAAFQGNPVSAFIFDLDGTLVTSDIDFAALQRDIGCPRGGDVLAFANHLHDPDERTRVLALIEEIELKDAQTSVLIDGALGFVQRLHQRAYPIAIVTRNSQQAARLKITRAALPISDTLIITREDAPPKPDPTALLDLAAQWALPPESIAYVGDYHFDVDAAHNAGMIACLRTNDYSRQSDYAQRADYCFDHYQQFEQDFLIQNQGVA